MSGVKERQVQQMMRAPLTAGRPNCARGPTEWNSNDTEAAGISSNVTPGCASAQPSTRPATSLELAYRRVGESARWRKRECLQEGDARISTLDVEAWTVGHAQLDRGLLWGYYRQVGHICTLVSLSGSNETLEA